MKELTIEANMENLERVQEFLSQELEAIDCPMKAELQLHVAVDELFSNIVNYAYNPETGPATVRVEVAAEPLEVRIAFIDHGVQYDPLAKEDPDITLSAEEREIGGLGIYLVKKTMDSIDYEYKNGENILRIRKSLEEQ